MKKFLHLRLFSVLALALFCAGTMWATEVSKTYVFKSSDTKSKTITDDQSKTWACSSASKGGTNDELPADFSKTDASCRGACFQSNGVTVTSDETFENVTKIIVECSANNTANGISVKVGESSIGGTNATTITKNNHKQLEFKSTTPLNGKIQITISRTGNSVWLGGVIVTTEDDGKEVATASFPESSYNVSGLTSTFDAPTLTTNSDGKVTYTSSDKNVATVDENTGAVEIKGYGSTTITATIAGSDNYRPTTASYVLAVRNPNVIKESFIFTNGNDYNLTPNNDAYLNNPTSFNEGVVSVKFDGSSCARYFTESDNSTSIRWYANNAKLLKISVPEGCLIQKITFSTTTNTFLAYINNTTNGIWTGSANEVEFTCTNTVRLTGIEVEYFTSDTFQPATYTITVDDTNKGHATYFNGTFNMVLPAGVKAYAYGIENGNLAHYEIANGDNEGENILSAGVAVVLHTTGETYQLTETTKKALISTSDANRTNLLRGTDTETTITVPEGDAHYILSHGDAGIAFYKAHDTSNTFTNGAHKAYLEVKNGATSAPARFDLGLDGTTGIEAISIEAASDNAIYNIYGQRVNENYKGIVIKNGKKFYNK